VPPLTAQGPLGVPLPTIAERARERSLGPRTYHVGFRPRLRSRRRV